MGLKALVKPLLPPLALGFARVLARSIRPSASRFAYAPDGWQTVLADSYSNGHESPRVIALELENWNPFISRIQIGHAPIVTPGRTANNAWQQACEHNVFMSFGYVLTLAARRCNVLRVLDYGGSFGGLFHAARAMVPDLDLNYHCKEMPEVARAGRDLTPAIVWHTDDSCLDQRYDLVMFNGSLQYIKDWKNVLRSGSHSACEYLYLTAVPIVESVPTFVAIQRHEGAVMLHQQFNKSEFFGVLEGTGLRLVREFWQEDHPHVARAPEQPSFYSCLLKRDH